MTTAKEEKRKDESKRELTIVFGENIGSRLISLCFVFQLLYIVPNADNPSGITLSEDRRREIYSLACEYDILIMEDDPYYYQQYGPKVGTSS